MNNVLNSIRERPNLTCKPAETRNFTDLFEDAPSALAQHQGLTSETPCTVKRDNRAHSMCVNSEFEAPSSLSCAGLGGDQSDD